MDEQVRWEQQRWQEAMRQGDVGAMARASERLERLLQVQQQRRSTLRVLRAAKALPTP
jgi:hypothetical protein